MIQVKENKITKYSLPKSGRLSTGETVSGYHLLDEEILKDEGWLPLEDIRPEYDNETHYLQPSGYDIQDDKVVRLYEIVEIPPREPDPMDRIRELEETLNILLENEELIGKLRVNNSQWEIDAEYYEEVMQILNELKLEVHESV